MASTNPGFGAAISDIFAISMKKAVIHAAVDGMSQINPQFNQIFKVAQNAARSRTAFTTVNRKLAAGAEAAILNSYNVRVESQKRFASYRVGNGRLSGGVLRRALENGGAAFGDFNGIYIGNRDILSSEAKHWGRLNFGAGEAANELYGNNQHFAFRIGGRQLGSFSFDEDARPGFLMPRGIWDQVGTRGRQPGFYPLRSELTLPTRGIQARRFLDAGIRYLASHIGPTYEDFTQVLIERALRTGKGAGTAITGQAK